MELHEENKLMREALDQIARYQADGPFHARRTLAAIGPAAQPEGETALRNPHTGQLRDYRDVESDPAGILCVKPGDTLRAAPQAGGDSISIQFSREQWGLIFDGVMLEISRSEGRKAANSESNSDLRSAEGKSILEAIRLAATYQPAPQAGDALDSIDTPTFEALWRASFRGEHGDYQKTYQALAAHIDASRREAYDKGRGEGVVRDKLKPMHEEDGSLCQWYFDSEDYYIDVARDQNGKYSIYFRERKNKGEGWLDQTDTKADPFGTAAPPASAAQQEARPMPTSAREALREVSTAYFMNTECERAEAVVGMIEEALDDQREIKEFEEEFEKTGGEKIDACNFLLQAAEKFWYACRSAGEYGAVKWLMGSGGQMLIFTRGEYRETLMRNIESQYSAPVIHYPPKD